MKKIAYLAIVAISASGCAIQPQSGNYTQAGSVQQHLMAVDSAKQVYSIYPASSTRLVLSQSAEDSFGRSLIAQLRRSGYAVVHAPSSKLAHPQKAVEGSPLSYTVDHLDALYFVRVRVGSSELSRAYQHNATATPASPWALRTVMPEQPSSASPAGRASHE